MDGPRRRVPRPAAAGCGAARRVGFQDQGASEQHLRNIAAEGLQEIYFKHHGRRAQDLQVEFTDVDYIDFEL
ncbi:hypothetical protein ACWGH4_02720 [Streptomyces sp. NPDC054847]